MFEKELARLEVIRVAMIELQSQNDRAQSTSHEDYQTRVRLVREHWELDCERHKIQVAMENERSRIRTMTILNSIPPSTLVTCQCHNDGHVYKEVTA